MIYAPKDTSGDSAPANQQRKAPESVAEMLARVPRGVPLAQLVGVADNYIAKWATLADLVASGEHLDGRASIYTGETYAEARDRWTAYRDALTGERTA